MSDGVKSLAGYPQDHGWVPHQPETWTYRFATLVNPHRYSEYAGYWEGANAKMNYRDLPAGTRVKIVMVSRFGDVGVNDDLDAERGRSYGLRLPLNELRDFSNDKEPTQ